MSCSITVYCALILPFLLVNTVDSNMKTITVWMHGLALPWNVQLHCQFFSLFSAQPGNLRFLILSGTFSLIEINLEIWKKKCYRAYTVWKLAKNETYVIWKVIWISFFFVVFNPTPNFHSYLKEILLQFFSCEFCPFWT